MIVVEKEKLRTVVSVDLKSVDAKVKRMLSAYEEFKKACNDIEPGFCDGNIEIIIKK